MVGRLFLTVCIAISGVLSFAPPALAGLRALDRMMVELAASSAQSAETIRRVYQDHLDILMLREYGELAGALDNGGLVPLPDQPLRFNIVPRLDGPHPIGEKDLANQSSYTAARAATIGALLEIASRVKSGPVEITSLVRHSDYQEELRTTNPNAITSVPVHTMGLAADIGLVNTPLETIYEIRDVLRRMQDDGDILFIGERRQLVFHVVPHPSRRPGPGLRRGFLLAFCAGALGGEAAIFALDPGDPVAEPGHDGVGAGQVLSAEVSRSDAVLVEHLVRLVPVPLLGERDGAQEMHLLGDRGEALGEALLVAETEIGLLGEHGRERAEQEQCRLDGERLQPPLDVGERPL
jgi:hypothetical protein